MSILSEKTCAIYVRNLVKRYGKGPLTLKNVNMTVNKGTIYGMLGASGCGKTTILSCIVGLQEWDSGEIFVLGQIPGKQITTKLGYMPQDLALYDQLSIYEIVQFYGKLYRISNDQLEERWDFLKGLLEFPAELNLIRNMSGGQQRRASLALALVHNPELLVIDEPTVGLDPVLRQKIWHYLRTLVNTVHTTVIITTHYIEEARYFDVVSVMRNGRIIIETPPKNMLERYNCFLLEDAVSKLCRDDETQFSKQVNRNLDSTNPNMLFGKVGKKSTLASTSVKNSSLVGVRNVPKFDCEINPNEQNNDVKSVENTSVSGFNGMHHNFEKAHGLTMVMALTLIRHPVFLVVLMIMPTIQCCLALATIGARARDVHFGVVNHDLINWKADCERHEQSQSSCDSAFFSCRFLNIIQEDDLLALDSFESETTAIEQVQVGQLWGYISIPSNYSTHLRDLAMQKHFASNETLEGSRIRFRLDHSHYLIAFFVKKHLYNSYLNFSTQLAESCGMSKGEFELPINFQTPVYGDYSDNYIGFMLPGDLLMSIFCLPAMLSGLLFIADHKQGTLRRARVAGLNIVHILSSHLIIQSVVTLIQIGIVTAFQYFTLGIEIRGHQLQFIYLLLCYLTGLVSTPFGLLEGIVFREEIELFVFSMLFVPIYLFWGGVCFPTETTTWFWQQVGYVVPIKLPIMSLRSAFVRKLGITHNLVWPGIFTSVICMYVFSAACIIMFKILKL